MTKEVKVQTQDEIPQAVYAADPGYTGVHVARDKKGYLITFEYGDN